MNDRLSLRLVPDDLWALVESLVPKFRPRPQGGGTAPLDELGSQGLIDWSRAILDEACVRAEKGYP